MTYDLTYIETYRRVTDDQLVIVGMHKKPVEAFVDFHVYDLGQLIGIGNANPSGVAYLMYYTAVRDEEGDSGPLWTEHAEQQLEKLKLDVDEIYWLCVWGEGRWARDYNDGLEVDIDKLAAFDASLSNLSGPKSARRVAPSSGLASE
ncbi:hypothetical protein [Hyphomicrobium sp.]|uniref:hypothetical protein n=1 Tax=Hyphomicrobium sp. TaxID=82 RepID=UPI000FA50C34|nr:hypothetical protein [Hyphomicrobium sp.]RUO97673.1 MAG: hypothetical protein EKK30_12975 [Hyphomicrobium sp.]